MATSDKSTDIFEGFVNRYSLSKTISFRLIPDERSQAFIDERGLVREDARLADDAFRAKSMMDEAHRAFIERVLQEEGQDLAGGFEEMAALADALSTEKEATEKARIRSKLSDAKDAMRKRIAGALRSDDGYKRLFGSVMRMETMPGFLADDPESVAMFKGFDKLDALFSKYDDNRRILYAADGEAGSVASRIVDDNFPRHLSNVEAWRAIEGDFPEVAEKVAEELSETLGGLPDMTPAGFVGHLSQEGIERMNAFIGGVVVGDGAEANLKGVNQLAHEHAQKTGAFVPRMASFYKQVLSDRASALSFLPRKIESDSECFEQVAALHSMLAEKSVWQLAASVLESADDAAAGVCISSRRLGDLSECLFGRGGKKTVDDALGTAASGKWGGEFPFTDGMSEKKRGQWRKKKLFKWEEVAAACSLSAEPVSSRSLSALVRMHARKADEAFEMVMRERGKVESGRKLAETPTAIAALKDFLDALLDALHVVRVFDAPAFEERDGQFYAAYDALLDTASEIVPVYNRVRNYATRRPYSTRKFQLHFSMPTVGAGWDANKEGSNGMIMLRKDGAYYVGISHKPARKLLKQIPLSEDNEPFYEKMVYRQARSAMMALPKSYIKAKAFAARIAEERPDILAIYEKGTFKKNLANGKPNPGFDVKDVRTLVDWYKRCLASDENMRVFDFRFSPTESYESIHDFYREFDAQAYSTKFVKVSEKFVDDMVEKGDLYLFRMWSRHMGKNVHGTGSMYLHWWNQLFSEQNAETPVLKLMGGAELFFRPASIDEPVVHRKGSVLVNRTMVDPVSGKRERIPEGVYQDIYRWKNGKIREESMSEEARELWATGRVVAKEAAYDIVKDRRFAEDRYIINIAMSINRLAGQAPYPVVFNDSVLREVADDPDLRIVGINRGERNLVYATVIDRTGAIVEQRGFNVIDGFDWRARLDEIERGRKEARRDWQSQDGIKSVKEAYISCVVRDIVDMMAEHRAMVAIEDLSSGFVNGRAKIEKNVYRMLEQKLANKLSYLASKPKYVDPWQPGGACCGYQLALPSSIEGAPRQNGFMLYANPWKVSAIDPATGFANLFDMRPKSEKEALEFFSRFRSIRYNPQQGWFEFSWDYSDFDELKVKGWRTEWTACTHGTPRTLTVPRTDGSVRYWKTQQVDLTEKIRLLLDEAEVEYADGRDLKDVLADGEKAIGRGLFEAFGILTRIRYSAPYENDGGEDYVLSPVAGKDGSFFDSRTAAEDMPRTGDANDAYHIALKALQSITEDVSATKSGEYVYLSFPERQNEEWIRFAQQIAQGAR